MKHGGSACLKGCLDYVRPVTELTEISLSTSYNQCHNIQYTNKTHVGSSGLLSCFYVYSQSSCKKWQLKLSGLSIHPSIPQQGTGQISPNGFSWNFTFGIINDLKVDKMTHTLHEDLSMVTISCQWQILIQRMVQPSNYSPTRHDWPVFASLSLNDWSSELRQTVRCYLL